MPVLSEIYGSYEEHYVRLQFQINVHAVKGFLAEKQEILVYNNIIVLC